MTTNRPPAVDNRAPYSRADSRPGPLQPRRMDEKKTACIKIWMAPSLELLLHRLAAADDRKLSDYLERALRAHVYGQIATLADDQEGPIRPDAP
jgi:hypothetical protein